MNKSLQYVSFFSASYNSRVLPIKISLLSSHTLFSSNGALPSSRYRELSLRFLLKNYNFTLSFPCFLITTITSFSSTLALTLGQHVILTELLIITTVINKDKVFLFHFSSSILPLFGNNSKYARRVLEKLVSVVCLQIVVLHL